MITDRKDKTMTVKPEDVYLVQETFRNIRNFLCLIDTTLFKLCDSEESQFEEILNLLESDYEYQNDNSIAKKYHIKESYDISFEYTEGTGERNSPDDEDGSYDPVDCFWVIKIKDRYFKINGKYCSWNGTDYYWDDIEEVKPYEKLSTHFIPVDKSSEI